ncbi:MULTISPECIES: hypothetical protein [Desulfovibrio]|uniref:Uncharacterized protein n=2 Tax=Desulfovibrio TaxID=872 RepID=A0AA94L1B4_DESDE|nr:MULTISPECIES: hypothetical protein [Desulfovibrio]ATD81646.1 hypothetical protein CNY67_09865 [Desulfovibrio sp. G11]MDY0203809.1 hypothetical protein [Desulfovibrio desulfuricans]SFW18542.1 hypothetical protein SAMN02910291_00311 [Desulfovibrio desulfuricans]SPD34373.1 Prokaryotic membrane lipoprotein lipid attachment site profile [Desulfovibrio sp. G11]
MNKTVGSAGIPYIMLSTALAGCALFFGLLLWQGGHDPVRQDSLAYAPGFAVQADVVEVVRVVPLAGAKLRSPSVDAHSGAVVQLVY